jgi:ferredoxin-NADP reductase
MLLRLTQVRWEAPGVVSLTLRDPGSRELPSWAPGAHVDLAVKVGLIRQYSLCGDPGDRSFYQVAVLREPKSRGGSAAIHEALRVGDLIEVSEPRNHFEMVPAARYVFVAGGIGITPILPMVQKAAREGLDWHLHYGGRSLDTMAFLDLVGSDDRVSLYPENDVGLMPIGQLASDSGGAEIYCCGPAPLLQAIEMACLHQGCGENLHLERFAPLPTIGAEDETTFTAVVASTGQEVRVPPGHSLLSCLLDAGVDVLFSCEEGTCGSCETRVIEGTPLHRDSVLTSRQREGNGLIMPCVSRAKSARIVLDL